MRSFHSNILILCLCVLNSGCRHDSLDQPCSNTQVSYASDIAPLIKKSCTLGSCHVPGSAIGDLTNYDTLKEKIDLGLFYTMVIDLQIMPPGNPLSETQIQMIQCWLEEGATQN